jgi:hypothetical protein
MDDPRPTRADSSSLGLRWRARDPFAEHLLGARR